MYRIREKSLQQIDNLFRSTSKEKFTSIVNKTNLIFLKLYIKFHLIQIQIENETILPALSRFIL